MALNPTSIAIDDASGNPAVVSPSNPFPTGGGVASGATDSGNPVKVGGVYNTTPPTLTTGQRGDLQLGSRGSANVTLIASNSTNPIAANSSVADGIGLGSNTILMTMSYGYVFNGTSLDKVTKPNQTARLVASAATTNATSAKATAGNLFKITGYCAAAARKYLKFYNKATAPTVGTDTPVLTFALPPTAAFSFDFTSFGHYFSTGIAYAITANAADADNTAVAAGDVEAMNINYS